MKNFEVRKDELQAELIKMILDGLPLLEGTAQNFERDLPSISKGLKNNDKSVTDEEHKYILMITYRYDSAEEKVFAGEFNRKWH